MKKMFRICFTDTIMKKEIGICFTRTMKKKHFGICCHTIMTKWNGGNGRGFHNTDMRNRGYCDNAFRMMILLNNFFPPPFTFTDLAYGDARETDQDKEKNDDSRKDENEP